MKSITAGPACFVHSLFVLSLHRKPIDCDSRWQCVWDFAGQYDSWKDLPSNCQCSEGSGGKWAEHRHCNHRLDFLCSRVHPHLCHYVSSRKNNLKPSCLYLPALDSPQGLTAVNVTDTSALLLWQPSVATVDGYVVIYRADSGEFLLKELHDQISFWSDCIIWFMPFSEPSGGACFWKHSGVRDELPGSRNSLYSWSSWYERS